MRACVRVSKCVFVFVFVCARATGNEFLLSKHLQSRRPNHDPELPKFTTCRPSLSIRPPRLRSRIGSPSPSPRSAWSALAAGRFLRAEIPCSQRGCRGLARFRPKFNLGFTRAERPSWLRGFFKVQGIGNVGGTNGMSLSLFMMLPGLDLALRLSSSRSPLTLRASAPDRQSCPSNALFHASPLAALLSTM